MRLRHEPPQEKAVSALAFAPRPDMVGNLLVNHAPRRLVFSSALVRFLLLWSCPSGLQTFGIDDLRNGDVSHSQVSLFSLLSSNLPLK